MNELIIKKVSVSESRIKISIDYDGQWERYIAEKYFISEYNCDVSSVPESVAIVPLLGNLLPIAWRYDLHIKVKTLDKRFYEYLPKVIEGYRNMYPDVEFGGELIYESLDEKVGATGKGNTAAFFSGGVDAYYTFLRHRAEKPAIVTIWGSDIALDDTEGWNVVYKAVTEVSEKYDVKKYVIKSNFRTFINTENLTLDLQHIGWSWWHEFQHGMGLITLMAPVAYVRGIEKLYIASSYTADIKNLTCASDPSIDNFVRFAGCTTIHDGFEANRQEKIHYIVKYSEKCDERIDLRVCWKSRGGHNCCTCEKCCRTMTAIYLEGGDAKKFGFFGKNAEFDSIARNMKYRNSGLTRDWDILHEKFRERYTLKTVPKAWKWFYKSGTKGINNNVGYKIRITILRVKIKIRNFLNK